MKKLVLISFLTLFTSVYSFAGDDNAIGVRLTPFGFEGSFQTPFLGERIELDFGGSVRYYNVSAVYQFVRPIQNGFYWYAGGGLSSGIWTSAQNNEAGISFGLAFQGGVEYNFKKIPLRLSADFRPVVNFLRPDSRELFPYADSFGASVRYVF